MVDFATQTEGPPAMVDASVGPEVLILDEHQEPDVTLEPVEPTLSMAELEEDFAKRLDLIQKETLLAQEFPSIEKLRKGPNKSRMKVTLQVEGLLDQYLQVG